MTAVRVPFNRPTLVGTEIDYVRSVMERGALSGDGEFTRRCSALLESLLGARRVLLTTSGTHALELAALLLEVGPGDEVVIPSFTFVSTANAFLLRGATLVFADVREDTLNVDAADVAAKLTPRSKVVVPVHYSGVACDMRALLDLSGPRGIAVVEDNAHGLFGRYQGRALGSFGALAAQSFHDTKNFHCGEGGALVINDERLLARAEVVREMGTNRSEFLRGRVSRYSWVDVGSSYRPSDLLAAFLLAQLEAREAIQRDRGAAWQRYEEALVDWAAAGDVRLPHVPADCEPTWHVFHLVMPTAEARQALLDHLRERGIQAGFHYLPLHLSTVGRSLGGRAGDCPVTERIAERLVRLPLYAGLARDDQAYVIESVRAFRP